MSRHWSLPRVVRALTLAAMGGACSPSGVGDSPDDEKPPANTGSVAPNPGRQSGAGGSPPTGANLQDGSPPSLPPAGADALAARPSDAGAGANADAGIVTVEPQRIVPVIFIDTGGQAIRDDVKINGTIKVVEDHDGTLMGIESRPASLQAKVGIGLRGGLSSIGYAQKPYGIEIRDDKGEDLAVPLVGLPKESDFAFISCYSDKSCLRNAVAYDVSAQMGRTAGQWAPRLRFVELYLNGSYQGLYQLVEKIKRDKYRVSIPEPAADATAGDLTGGYIFSMEAGGTKPPSRYWLEPSLQGGKWFYRSPSSTQITAAQKTYLQGAVATLLQTLKNGPTWNDAKKVLDAKSSFDQTMLQELTNNTDAWARSWFFYKVPDSAGGKYFMGPAWDYDRGFGNVDYGSEYCTSGLLARKIWGAFGPPLRDTTFKNEARCRYQEHRQKGGALDVARIEAQIDAWVSLIEKAKARDNAKWKNVGKWVIPNNYIGATWKDEVTYLKYWIRRRLIWLDANYPGSCTTVSAPPTITPIAGPPPVAESTLMRPEFAPVYIPIEGPAPAGYESRACPK